MDDMTTQELRVLAHVDRRFTRGRWVRGRRTRGGLDYCLVAALDDASVGFAPEVRSRVMHELVRDLPRPLRVVGQWSPRATLAFYNDWVGRRRGTLRLVKTTLARLSTHQPFTAERLLTEVPARPWPSPSVLAAQPSAPVAADAGRAVRDDAEH
jgi:hypothetical protein